MTDWLVPAFWLLGFGVGLVCLYHVVRLAVRSALRDHFGHAQSVETGVAATSDES